MLSTCSGVQESALRIEKCSMHRDCEGRMEGRLDLDLGSQRAPDSTETQKGLK